MRPVAPTPNAPPMPIAAAGPRPRSIGALVAGFKASATKEINEKRGTPGHPVWQRNYYEHIIRNDDSLTHIREYIVNNPRQPKSTALLQADL